MSGKPTIKAIAQAACAYVNEHIMFSSTKLNFNQFSADKAGAINTVLRLTRNYMPKDIIAQEFECDYMILYFEHLIEACNKTNTGNCAEMAWKAFEYMLENHPDISAEYFSIAGGDHAFLVINRSPDSKASDPTTWGDDAYICDPWSNTYYPAKEYLDKLYGFYRYTNEAGRRMNNTLPFDKSAHKLKTEPNMSSDFFLSFENGDSKKALLNSFKELFNRINQALLAYKFRLSVKKFVLQLFASDPNKPKIEKIDELLKCEVTIKEELALKNDYRQLAIQLYKILEKHLKNSAAATGMTEQALLSEADNLDETIDEVIFQHC